MANKNHLTYIIVAGRFQTVVLLDIAETSNLAFESSSYIFLFKSRLFFFNFIR